MLTIRLFKYSILIFGFIGAVLFTTLAHGQPIQVCATVPELGNLAREVGGEHVSVTVFAKGTEDPHFVVPRPSYIKDLSLCEAYVQTGMALEQGWAPPLLQNSRNPALLPGRIGFIDASIAIVPLQVPVVAVSRAMGDLHPEGNPHYLLSPMNGLRVADLLKERFNAIRPANGLYFNKRYADFRQRLGVALVGEALANKYDFEKLVPLAERNKLMPFLQSQGEEGLLGGWIGAMQPYYGAKVVSDHQQWAYFAQLFGLDVVQNLEPFPGVPPTTKHLNEVIALMKADSVKVVLASAYYNLRYARFVSENTGASVLPMANQVEARPGTEQYLGMVDYNVKQLAGALGGTM